MIVMIHFKLHWSENILSNTVRQHNNNCNETTSSVDTMRSMRSIAGMAMIRSLHLYNVARGELTCLNLIYNGVYFS